MAPATLVHVAVVGFDVVVVVGGEVHFALVLHDRDVHFADALFRPQISRCCADAPQGAQQLTIFGLRVVPEDDRIVGIDVVLIAGGEVDALLLVDP